MNTVRTKEPSMLQTHGRLKCLNDQASTDRKTLNYKELGSECSNYCVDLNMSYC